MSLKQRYNFQPSNCKLVEIGEKRVAFMSANIFDAEFYLAVNPDLAAAGLTTEKQLYRHLLTFGLQEGRRFSPLVGLKQKSSSNEAQSLFKS